MIYTFISPFLKYFLKLRPKLKIQWKKLQSVGTSSLEHVPSSFPFRSLLLFHDIWSHKLFTKNVNLTNACQQTFIQSRNTNLCIRLCLMLILRLLHVIVRSMEWRAAKHGPKLTDHFEALLFPYQET